MELKQALSLSEGSPVLLGHLGRAYGLSGAREEAARALGDLKTLGDRQYVPSSATALVHLGLGDKAQALDWLDRAYQEHDFSLVFLGVAPWFNGLRGEARLSRLTGQMQLPERSPLRR